jgi:hypothetical protein
MCFKGQFNIQILTIKFSRRKTINNMATPQYNNTPRNLQLFSQAIAVGIRGKANTTNIFNNTFNNLKIYYKDQVYEEVDIQDKLEVQEDSYQIRIV